MYCCYFLYHKILLLSQNSGHACMILAFYQACIGANTISFVIFVFIGDLGISFFVLSFCLIILFLLKTLIHIDYNTLPFQWHLNVSWDLLFPLAWKCFLFLNNSLTNKLNDFKTPFHNVSTNTPFLTFFLVKFGMFIGILMLKPKFKF